MASSSASVAPLFAARVAPALRSPCAALGTPAGLPEPIPEAFLGHGASARRCDKREMALVQTAKAEHIPRELTFGGSELAC
jgi:hypothetical protein